MTDYTSESRAEARYGTGSHNEAITFFDRDSSTPHQMKWEELHPKGKCVLPKGYDGEYNSATHIKWEDTLGGQFARALARLEGLLYAVYGSKPRFKLDDEGDPATPCQWYDSPHPRCNWNPEIWGRTFNATLEGCIDNPDPDACYKYTLADMEYTALGQKPSPLAFKSPRVPIKTRTTDTSSMGFGAYFPPGSVVVSDANSDGDVFTHNYGDPLGSGWFGASQPGRQDSQPWLSEDNGYTWILNSSHPNYLSADEVKIEYTRPDGVEIPNYVAIYYRERTSEDEEWGSWNTGIMSNSGNVYTYTFDRQAHGHQIMWYLHFYKQITPQNRINRFAPGDEIWPEPSEEHLFIISWFTHYNPYRNGLPELLSSYPCGPSGEEIDIRHGTDHYTFDGAETIQPELINLVRFTVSWLGGKTCAMYDGCTETKTPSNRYSHNPRLLRQDPLSLCCMFAPIHFYWSGSNAYPLYRRGGKGGPAGDTVGTRPLVNFADHPLGSLDYGSEDSRLSWRGTWQLYEHIYGANDQLLITNEDFGDGVSWGTPPGETVLFYTSEVDNSSAVRTDYSTIGLQAGDVIDAVHIQELIDAINYLVDYGIWETTEMCTKRRTPSGRSFRGYTCGEYGREKERTVKREEVPGCNAGIYENEDFYKCYCGLCCANADAYGEICLRSGAEGGFDALGCCWNGEIWVDGLYDPPPPCPFEPGSSHCLSTTSPTWEDCVDECPNTKCRMFLEKNGNYTTNSNSELCIATQGGWSRAVWCDAYQGDYNGQYNKDGGYHGNTYTEYDSDGKRDRTCARSIEGSSFYLCTPRQCHPQGWDASLGIANQTHGNNADKHRWEFDEWNQSFNQVSGVWRSGNCWGDLFLCGDLYPLGGQDLWFEQVIGVEFNGIVPHWHAGCDDLYSESGADWGSPYDWPEPVIPGIGNEIYDLNGEYQFSVCENFNKEAVDPYAGPFESWWHWCEIRLLDILEMYACKDDKFWVAVDLNLDNTGRPYRKFPGIGHNNPPGNYDGEGIPVLRPYDIDNVDEASPSKYNCVAYTATLSAQNLDNPLS